MSPKWEASNSFLRIESQQQRTHFPRTVDQLKTSCCVSAVSWPLPSSEVQPFQDVGITGKSMELAVIAGSVLTILQNREAVFATRQSLGLMKSKLKGAQTGHDLLKRKSEALTK